MSKLSERTPSSVKSTGTVTRPLKRAIRRRSAGSPTSGTYTRSSTCTLRSRSAQRALSDQGETGM
jgi:hypothetical protein